MAITDYLTQTFNQTGAQAGQQAQAQQNVYTPGQTSAQGNVGQLYQQLLQGNIPQSFTAPQPVLNAFSANFDNMVAPQLASQFGAGSSVMGSQKALGLQQLMGQMYNTGVGNFMNALGGYQNYAFGTPVGGVQAGTNLGQQSNAGQNVTSINPLLMMLLQGISALTG